MDTENGKRSSNICEQFEFGGWRIGFMRRGLSKHGKKICAAAYGHKCFSRPNFGFVPTKQCSKGLRVSSAVRSRHQVGVRFQALSYLRSHTTASSVNFQPPPHKDS